MRIKRDEISAIVNSGPNFGGTLRRHSVDRLIDRLRESVTRSAKRNMQPWLILLNESVQFFIHFERYLSTLKNSKEVIVLWLQVARLRSDIIAIREIILVGQTSPTQVMARVFLDNIEVAMAIIEDPGFANEYANTEDELAFWKKNIGYGRIYSRVESFIKNSERPEDEVDDYVARHKAFKNFLSGRVHPAHSGSMWSALQPSIEHPGLFHHGKIGALSAYLPKMCHLIAMETHIFGGCCISRFTNSDPPPALSDFKPCGMMSSFVMSSHVLQELIVKYSHELEILEGAFFDEYDEVDYQPEIAQQ